MKNNRATRQRGLAALPQERKVVDPACYQNISSGRVATSCFTWSITDGRRMPSDNRATETSNDAFVARNIVSREQ